MHTLCFRLQMEAKHNVLQQFISQCLSVDKSSLHCLQWCNPTHPFTGIEWNAENPRPSDCCTCSPIFLTVFTMSPHLAKGLHKKGLSLICSQTTSVSVPCHWSKSTNLELTLSSTVLKWEMRTIFLVTSLMWKLHQLVAFADFCPFPSNTIHILVTASSFHCLKLHCFDDYNLQWLTQLFDSFLVMQISSFQEACPMTLIKTQCNSCLATSLAPCNWTCNCVLNALSLRGTFVLFTFRWINTRWEISFSCFFCCIHIFATNCPSKTLSSQGSCSLHQWTAVCLLTITDDSG